MNGNQSALVKNAGDPEQVAKASRHEKREANHADDDLFNVMNTPAGRRLVWKLLGDYGLYRNAFSPDQRVMAYQCGEHAAALKLLSELMRVCPELYLTAQQEAQIKEKQDAAERQQ